VSCKGVFPLKTIKHETKNSKNFITSMTQ